MKLFSGILMMLLSWHTFAHAEPVVLSVYGKIRMDGQAYSQLDFTLNELQALKQADITTSHPWSNEPRHYHGVDLNDLLDRLFSQQKVLSIQLEAINDFSIEIDWSRIASYMPILAWQEDQRVMSLRNKGPLWLMLPFDKVPSVQQADFIHFMAWQLKSIRVYSEPQ
ncbi:molybdopterin-binding protein [Oceanisphaera pacifica]|uniref:Molybdopterin-binding protein n=1 Tax=Oceanisphaera pacifica TaxID=2818389 RepID=A0ABS3NCQ7_9GAMM|nr:molybdopterin-binding protein [Oceanisphaera pacifica]MBO1518377.1 molybdopterin-binding protein [Oceanisphaera pacifica]